MTSTTVLSRGRRALATAATVPLLVVGLAACGGDQERSPEAAADALDDWLTYFSKGNGKACNLETDDYSKALNEAFAEFSEDEDEPTCRERILQARVLAEAFDEDLSVLSSAEIETIEDGKDRVVLEATYKDGDAERYAMAYEGGKWLVDGDSSTEDDLEIPDDSDSDLEDEDGDEEEDGPSDDEIAAMTDQWVAGWCSLAIGMTQDETVEVMGTQTEEYDISDDTTPQYGWSQGPYSFTAFFDTDGLVNSFYADYDALGASDLAQMPCVEDDGSGYLDRTDG